MQSRKDSLKETCWDIGIGFIISICATFIINWIHSVDIPTWKNFTMTICFTIVSLIRSYATRRYFNNKELIKTDMENQELKILIEEGAKVFSEEQNFEKTIEEVGELLQAIQKTKSDVDSPAARIHLYGELIDVFICVEIALIKCDGDTSLPVVMEDVMKAKIERFAGRIEEKRRVDSLFPKK